MAWYDKKWVIILSLILCWPIGLFLMWRSPTFSTKTKGLVTAFFALILIVGSSNKQPPKSKTQNPPVTTNAEQPAPAPVQQAEPTPPVTTNVEPTKQSPTYDDKVKEITRDINQAQPPAPVKFPDLGMTVVQFKNAFAAVASNYGIPQFNINNAIYRQGSVQDILEYKFSANVSLSCQVNKSNGLVRTANVTLIPLTDGDAAIAFITYEILVTIFNPELTQDERNALFDELCLVEDKILALRNSIPKVIRGNRKYSVVYVEPVDSIGMFLLSVSNRDDN